MYDISLKKEVRYMSEDNNCCICFLSDSSDTSVAYWTCATCQTKCHMTCITRWAQSNHNRYHSTFSCPVCRHNFDLSTLPGVQIPPPAPRVPFVIPRPVMVVNENPFVSLRPSLASFINTVLQATRQPAASDASQHSDYRQEFSDYSEQPNLDQDTTDHIEIEAEIHPSPEHIHMPPETSSRIRRPSRHSSLMLVTGTGPIHVDRVTIINRF